jgi:hypothetical protein
MGQALYYSGQTHERLFGPFVVKVVFAVLIYLHVNSAPRNGKHLYKDNKSFKGYSLPRLNTKNTLMRLPCCIIQAFTN